MKLLIFLRANVMQLLLQVAKCNMENVFRVSHILQLISQAFRRVQ